MYDVSDFSYLRTFEAPTDTQTIAHTDVLSNFDGSLVIRHFDARVPSSGTRIAVWNTNSGNLINYFYEDYAGTPFSFSNDNQKLISDISASRLFVFSLVTGEKLSEINIPGNSPTISMLSNPPSNQMFIFRNPGLYAFNLDDQIQIFSHYIDIQKLLAISKDGSILAGLYNNYYNTAVSLWNLNTNELIFKTTNNESVGSAAISQDNKYLFVSTQSDNSKILIYDLQSKLLGAEITGQGKIIHLSALNGPYDFISITNNSRNYWTYEKDWMELK